ncbi:ATP-binding protein [Oscillatoria sp. FACHB-1406]|uniref:ATP-binding protein n=1 Tax=Oscillatoria sp. FACHB-1406 TaxID=2692846 RepID=UPI00168A36AC|nr:ATP-binding protein [Oscillatoria sp. FACHB-1406]MBD2579045.1 HAMP domain-containing protein [Oscillatoria sp. FACHB-1406]
MLRKWIHQVSDTVTSQQSSLARVTLMQMTSCIAAVVLLSCTVSYFHLMEVLQTRVRLELGKYVAERGQRESQIFQLAESNQALTKEAFLSNLQAQADRDPQAEFDRLFYTWSDGTVRNAPQNQPTKTFDTLKHPTVFIGKGVKLTPDVKRRAIAMYEVLSAYAPAWRNQFVDTCMAAPDNINACYWVNVPLNLDIPAETNITTQESFYIGDKAHNPTRKPVWTGAYLDSISGYWMVSLTIPIDNSQGNYIANGGHNIKLNKLIDRTVNNYLRGTQNMMFREDGRLIAHPDLLEEIKAGKGELTIQKFGDPHLQRVYEYVKAMTPDQKVIDNPVDREFIAVNRIKGPDWYFVTIYPKSLLIAEASKTIQVIFLTGFLTLIVEIISIWLVLKSKLLRPLKQLTAATHKIANGNFEVCLNVKRPDEIGQLAGSFNHMVQQLQYSFRLLERTNEELEIRVKARTNELSRALAHLKNTQTQLVQTEKMSSLGQLVAGIAHEINNPINFIHGNLGHVNNYTKDMLVAIKLYQKYSAHLANEIQESVEDLDLDFIANDLPRLLSSMKQGTTRVREIVLGLRNFSRLGESDFKPVNLHEGIDNTLLILDHRLKTTDADNNTKHPAIQVQKQYGDLPLVVCYAGLMNQVFMNLLINAIDALEKTPEPTIIIRTERLDRERVKIAIADNGVGIPKDIQARIFDPFFTTKPVGKGTGLGLAICYQVVVDGHGGKLFCDSTPGVGTEFAIEIPIDLANMVT